MQLGTREYWAQFQPAPEMVVLFLAGDHFLSAALARNGELLEQALARKVLLATPVTLVSVLKGIAIRVAARNGWRKTRANCVASPANSTIVCAGLPISTLTQAGISRKPSTHTIAQWVRGIRGSLRRSNACAS
jgi:hypothetical protein